MARQETQGVDGYILEFERDGVAGCGKGGEARFVVPCRLGVMRGDVRGDAFAVGGVDMRPVTELRRRDGEHAAELAAAQRSAEHTSELQSLMRISSAVFCLKKKT